MTSTDTKSDKMPDSKEKAHDNNSFQIVPELILKIAPEKDLFGQRYQKELYENKGVGKHAKRKRSICIIAYERHGTCVYEEQDDGYYEPDYNTS